MVDSSAFLNGQFTVKMSRVSAHKTGTNLWGPGIHSNPACREFLPIHEIMAQSPTNPCLFAFSMIATQRAFSNFRFHFYHIFTLSSAGSSEAGERSRALASSRPSCLSRFALCAFHPLSSVFCPPSSVFRPLPSVPPESLRAEFSLRST